MPDTINWEGLKSDLQNKTRAWTPIDQGTAIDFDGLRREMGYTDDVLQRENPYKFKTQVTFDREGKPWYELLFQDMPQFVADKVLYTSPLMAMYAYTRDLTIELVERNPQLKKKIAKTIAEQKRNLPVTAIYLGGVGQLQPTSIIGQRHKQQYVGPAGWETAEDIIFGLEEGAAQFVELLIGQRPATFADAIDKIDFEGTKMMHEAGEITDEDWQRYVKGWVEAKENPLLRDITAGLTNSALIMGSLYATGGITQFTTRGLKVFSKEWLKTWGKGLWKQGVATWKLLGTGATIGSISDSIDEMKTMKENGEDPDAWDFIADLGLNMFRKHGSAFLEGMSEGVLLNMRMGSVPLKKWLQVPVKIGRQKSKLLGVKELRRLINSTTSPVYKSTYKKALNQLLGHRKDIAKQISKNFGKSLANAYGIEIGTEQITDIFSDLSEGTHSSLVNLVSSVPEHRREALKTLIIEAAVSTALGYGMGMSEIFSRKPIEEIAEQFGDDFAREIEKELNGQNKEELHAKIKKAKQNPNNFNADIEKEKNAAAVILDQGKGTDVTEQDEVTEPTPNKSMQGVHLRRGQIFANTINTVESLNNPNVLDYIVEQGRQELAQYFLARAAQDKDFRYNIDSFIMDADQHTINAITGAMYRDIIELASQRGLIDAVNWTKKGESNIQKDLAIGIALKFDETGWAFIKHKYQTNDNIDFYIEEARKLQATNQALSPNTRVAKKYGAQTIQGVQTAAHEQYKKSMANNIGLSIGHIGSIIDAEIALRDQEELFDEHTGILKGGIAGAEVVKDDEDNLNYEDLGSFIDDEDILTQTANTEQEFNEKATRLANLTGLNYTGFITLSPQEAVFSFTEPTTGSTVQVTAEELSYSTLIKKAIQARGGRPMHAVAYKDLKTGKVYQNGPGLTHPDLFNTLYEQGLLTEKDLDRIDQGDFEKGFVDKEGNYFSEDEAYQSTGLMGESATQGVNSNLDNLLFETSIPKSTVNLPKYSAILEGFEGHTIRELIEFLVNKGAINEKNKEFVAKLADLVGEVALIIAPMDPKNPGATMFDSKNVLVAINPEATLWDIGSVWDTLAHEMVHVFTRDFQVSGTLTAQIFNGKIKGVMNIVHSILYAQPNDEILRQRWNGTWEELQAYKKRHGQLILKAMANEMEFVSSVMTDTQAIRWITDRILMGGPRTRATGWRKVVRALQSALESFGFRRSATTEVANLLEREHKNIEPYLSKRNLRWNPRVAKENRRASKQTTSGFETVEYNDNEDPDDLLDPLQKPDEYEDEDENDLENAAIENFTRFMALASGIQEPAFREHVKNLADFESFVEEVDKTDKDHKSVISNKLNHLYQGYKDTFKTVQDFKRAFLKRQYLNIVTKESYDTFIYMGVKENNREGDSTFHYELRQVKGTYRDGKGKKRNTYRQKTALEDYIPELAQKLGLPEGVLKLGFIDGFEMWQNDKVVRRSTFDRLDAYLFNGDAKAENVPVTGYIADALWEGSVRGATKYGMLYIGNLAGKNTLPILFFDSAHRDIVEQALLKYGEEYYVGAIQHFGTEFNEGTKANPLTKGRELASITRAILEDLWFKAKFEQTPDGTWTIKKENSHIIQRDWNKLMKRATKWAALNTGIVITDDEVEQTLGNAPVNGIKFIPGDVLVNAAVISSKSDTVLTFKVGNREISRTLKQLMQNALGKSRIDGASFYIIGHFDKVYRLAHGALKDGALKNLYASRHKDDPLFIKHAMHGISANSPLGRFMIENNIAVLVSDESMKEGPQDKIITANELMNKEAFKEKNPIIPLKLSQFTRISESQYKDPRGGSTKQMVSGSGYSELYNDIIAEAMASVGDKHKVSEILKRFTDKMSQNTLKWFEENTTPEALYELLKDIVYNPKSPQEHAVAELWIDFIEPLEGQTIQHVLEKYGGAMQHAFTAEVIRNRMQHKLSEMLGGKTAGMRGVLDPNIGWLNHQKDVAPVEAPWNLADLLVTIEDLPSDIAKAAFPEPGLYEIAKQLLDLQRRDTRVHNQLKASEKRVELDNNEMTRQELIGKILALKSKRLQNVVNEKTTNISANNLINWADPLVQQWQDEVVWGTKRVDPDTKTLIRSKNGILDEETGALREGWAIITEDIADKMGVKSGDWILLVVTPTDSAMGVIGVRVAGIAKSAEAKKGGRKVSDRSKITVNSEWAQSLVGKDFDIDTISILTYDERFWEKDQFEFLCKVANKVPRKYLAKILEETKALFKEKGVVPKDADGNIIDLNEATVLRDEVRELFALLMNGTPGKQLRRQFPIVGASFIELDSAYLHDKAPIINERLLHSAVSTINMRASKVTVPFITNDKRLVTNFKVKGKDEPIEIDFVPRHKQWVRVHINHLHRTNGEVDFPNNTMRLGYVSNPRTKIYRIQMGSDFWGVKDQEKYIQMLGLDISTMAKLQKLNNLDTIFKALKGFQNFLFQDAFNLARQRNTETFEKLDYVSTIRQLHRAQNKLAALASNDKKTLKGFVKEYIEGEKKKIRRRLYEDSRQYKEALLIIEQQTIFLNSFVDNLEVDNVYDYPLFEAIRNIGDVPIPGNTYKDHLINQVLASQEAIPYYPVIKEAYDDAISHAQTSGSSLYKVRPDISYKPAYRILKILGQPTSDAVNVVRDLRKNKEHFEKLIKPLKPWELEDLKDAIREFDELDKRAGRAFDPFERDGQLVYVDMEAIAMDRIAQSLDYAENAVYKTKQGAIVTEIRGKLSRANPTVYWSRQLRGFRSEVNSILHAFDEKYVKQSKENISEQVQQIRHGHASTYPVLWKAILESPFLFLKSGKLGEDPHDFRRVNKVILKFNGEKIYVGHEGTGLLYFGYKGEKFSHIEVNNEINDKAKELKKLLTERNGLWEGVDNNSDGTGNRIEIAKIMTMARNLTMERRIDLLEEYIADNLYSSNRGFTRDDQIAFWIGIMAQTSDQGMIESKAVGFIVNQTPYDKLKPYKFQNNHVALTLMSRFETELTNLWLQLYSLAETSRNPQEKEEIAWAIRHGMDSDVEMLYQDAEVPNSDATFKHFFSDYVQSHQNMVKDLDFVKFYKKMRTADWKDGLQELRKMAEGVVMLKALSENGVFYEDLVRDLKTLTDAQFFEKYKSVDTTNIQVALERYMGDGIVDEFIRQRAGESDIEFRTRGNIISTFYLLNTVKKKEGARNKQLKLRHRLGSIFIGYDMVAILGEKQTRALDPRDEVVGTVWDVEGPRTITTREVQLSARTHATRTDMPIGESLIAMTKGQRINRTLSTHQITLNNQAKRFEDVAKLLSGHEHRNRWRVQFVHKRASKRIPHTQRTAYISRLLDQIPESSDMQLEIRREQIWNLAENLKKRYKINVLEDASGNVLYAIKLGTQYKIYKSAQDLIEAHLPKLKPTQKLALIGALDIRIMYDLMVPKYIEQVITYLEHTRYSLNLGAHMDQALQVDAMIDKYKLMLAAVRTQKGDYLPHQFPIARYQNMWMQGYLETAIKNIQRQIMYHKQKNTGHPLGLLDPKKDLDKIKEMALRHANKVWDHVAAGWNRGSIIPNFIPRRMPNAEGYTKTDPTIHYNYITKLIEGMKKDALRADWLLYQANARMAGERHIIMELTRNWYANQIGDKTFRTKLKKWSDVKPGMQVTLSRQAYILVPGDDKGIVGSAQVSGVVSKITKDEVVLNTDTEAILFEARRDKSRWEGAVATMMIHGFDEKPTQRQWHTLQNLINKSILTQKDFEGIALNKLDEIGAATLILKGIDRIIANPSIVNTFKRTEVWGNDVTGKHQDNMVNVYVGSGVIETLNAKADYWKNLDLIKGVHDSSMPKWHYNFWKTLAVASDQAVSGFKQLTSLFYMGLAAAGKARVVNQLGAIINNLIDAPIYNFRRWQEGSQLYSRIKHGQIELMNDEADIHLYKTLVGLGLTENNNILAIALEAANIKPEDMLINDATPDAIKWLARLFRDATKYDSTYKALEAKEREYILESDPTKRLAISGEINRIKLEWQAKMYNLLRKDEENGQLTDAREKELWKQLDEAAKKGQKMNLAQEQGFTKAMAIKLFAKVAWKSFFRSNLGVGFQAKAEKMRIPAFFIGYTTAIHMGFTHEEAVQLAVNSVELRHAFYGSANKQYGANSKMGTITFQYAQYQYNSLSKAIRILREMIPQMLRFAHSRPQERSKLQHLGKMFQLVQTSLDEKGKELKRGEVTLKEINLLHGVMMKILWSGVMMQIGSRIFYGVTNFQDPVSQVVYRAIDFVWDLVLGGGLDLDDEDDRDNLAWMLQDMAMPMGMLYKMSIQATVSAPIKGYDKTFFRGRVEDSFDFLWRVSNTIDMALWQLGARNKRPKEQYKTIFDTPWLIDDFTTGIKLWGWSAADNEPGYYTKYGFFGKTKQRKFTQGRYVETEGKGISFTGENDSYYRWLFLIDPLTYIPFLDRITTGK